jgi:hypothetical protein
MRSIQRGFVREAYDLLNTIYEQCIDFPVSKMYPGIPEYFNDRGRGMYTYLTGSASWLLLTVVNEMFGIQGRLGNLVLHPRLVVPSSSTGRVRSRFARSLPARPFG